MVIINYAKKQKKLKCESVLLVYVTIVAIYILCTKMKLFSPKQLLQKAKRAFTLIEILIVIAIIGILTVALLPRIQWAQSSARNTARKADLNQIATALAAYNGDQWVYPPSLDTVAWANGYLKSLPKDPGSKNACGSSTDGIFWGYYYKTTSAWYILAAYMEKQPGNPNVNYVGECSASMAPWAKPADWSDAAKYVIKVEN